MVNKRIILFFFLISFLFTPTVESTTRNWDGVGAWIYLLQDISVDKIKDANADLAVIDFSYDGSTENAILRADVENMKLGSPSKLIVSYISIGEAEDYRSYWQESWQTNPPSWLDSENPDWEGNYKVRYWDPAWQHIIFDYLNHILTAGFDGVYLDIIDAYEYYEDTRPTAAQDMINFVIAIANYTRIVAGEDFGIFPQNGADLLTHSDYISVITGIGQEDTYFADTNVKQDSSETAHIESRLDLITAMHKLVLTVDYATTSGNVAHAYDSSSSKGYIPYVTRRDLDTLTATYYDYINDSGNFLPFPLIGVIASIIVLPLLYRKKRTIT